MSDPKTAEGTKDVPSQPKKELLLSVDPERASFLPTGSRSEHMIANLGEKRAAVKVRCSDNALFRVNPVHMLIDAGQCQNLVVTRLPGEAKEDKLVLTYLPADEKATDARDVFKAAEQKPEMLRIPMNCVAPEDAPCVGPPAEKK
ncbi:Major sperm protein [Aphelenchoides fujianensis]|nr:Major sperm protein [Aphelenchoides fujianensis]